MHRNARALDAGLPVTHLWIDGYPVVHYFHPFGHSYIFRTDWRYGPIPCICLLRQIDWLGHYIHDFAAGQLAGEVMVLVSMPMPVPSPTPVSPVREALTICDDDRSGVAVRVGGAMVGPNRWTTKWGK